MIPLLRLLAFATIICLSAFRIGATGYKPVKMEITTSSGSSHILEIAEDMSVTIGDGALELTSSDMQFKMNILAIKGFRYILNDLDDESGDDDPGNPGDRTPEEEPDDQVTGVSAIGNDVSEIVIADKELKIISTAERDEYAIVNINGILILQGKFNRSVDINLSDIESGIYILHLSSGKTLKFQIK